MDGILSSRRRAKIGALHVLQKRLWILVHYSAFEAWKTWISAEEPTAMEYQSTALTNNLYYRFFLSIGLYVGPKVSGWNKKFIKGEYILKLAHEK